MRILLITNRYPACADDSASPFVPHFVAALRKGGVHVDVLTPRYRPANTMDREDAAFAEPPWIHRFASGSTVPIGSWSLFHPVSWLRLQRFLRNGYETGRALCRDDHYDHILALWALPSGYFARRLAREFNVPYSVWCLGSDIYAWAQRPIIRRFIARVLVDAACVFGDGEDLCRRVHAWLGIDCRFLPSFRPLAGVTVTSPPLATASPRYLYLGRLHRAKGIFELIDAFAMVHRALPGAGLRLVGHGPDARRLEQQVERQALGTAVDFTGAVAGSRVVIELEQTDFVVIPTKSDSLPLVFSEAVQTFRPVIGTDIGDLGEFIRQYRVGLVTPSSDPAGLSATMLAMASAPVFDLEGRADLLSRLDPRRAAAVFCTQALGAPAGQYESLAALADPVPRALSS
ncbi:MAG: glycosyltransferase [Candidatus Zixiibacteriota bacterium]